MSSDEEGFDSEEYEYEQENGENEVSNDGESVEDQSIGEDGEENEEEEEDEEDENGDLGEGEQPTKIFKNNVPVILQKLEETKIQNLPWIETLTLTHRNLFNEEVNPHDDFNRELAFYRQALAGCEIAKNKFESLGIPYRRPDDYFAEMIKSDAHMARVFNLQRSILQLGKIIVK